MKISGIICEYNPLHNGHLYHLEQVRRAGAEGIVAVMSGNFVQRGDAALLDKFTRARLAIEGGVDLVLELPVPYALAPAENFAMGGVALLTALGNVQEISFGSECGDIRLLSQAAEACRVCKTDYADVMDDFLRSGYSYPEVLSQMVGQLYGAETAAVLRHPNNTLAIAYLNAIHEMDSPLRPMTIQRRGHLYPAVFCGRRRLPAHDAVLRLARTPGGTAGRTRCLHVVSGTAHSVQAAHH